MEANDFLISRREVVRLHHAEKLSLRQRQVLLLEFFGLEINEMASLLGTSVQTVKNHAHVARSAVVLRSCRSLARTQPSGPGSMPCVAWPPTSRCLRLSGRLARSTSWLVPLVDMHSASLIARYAKFNRMNYAR